MMEKTTPESEDKKQSQPIALKLAGAGYAIGDVAGMAASKGRGTFKSMQSYAIWLAGAAAAGFFGNPSQEKQLEITSRKLQKHLRDKGIAIPQTSREQHALLSKPNFLHAVTDFMHEHPSELLNTAYGIGAGLLISNGIDDRKLGKKFLPALPKGLGATELSAFGARTNNRLWMGILVGAGALSGLLMKEDKAAREDAKDGGFIEKTLSYFREKPLRLTSTLYAANNIFTILEAVSDYHNRTSPKYGTFLGLKPHIYSGTMAGMYLLANGLLHTASRKQAIKGGYDEKSMAELEAMAAAVIAAQPTDKQRGALQDISAFLATQKNIKLKAPEIAEQLATRIAEKSREHLLAQQSAPMPVSEETPKSFAEKEASRRQHAQEEAHERS